MEKQKIVSKEVKMDVVKNDKAEAQEKGQQKLSYEQLNQACGEMSQQLQQMDNYIQQLRRQNQQLSLMVNDKRMDFLFGVVKIASKWNPSSEYPCFAKDFVEKCIAEIQEALTIPQEPEEDSKEK